MKKLQLFVTIFTVLLSGCSSVDNQGTIAQLRDRKIEITAEEIDGGLEKAIAGYQRFLEESQSSAMTPEALRRLADLKVEKEYGLINDGKLDVEAPAAITAPEPAPRPEVAGSEGQRAPLPAETETDSDFEQRTTLNQPIPVTPMHDSDKDQAIDDLEKTGPM